MTYQEFKKINPSLTETDFEIAIRTTKDLMIDTANKLALVSSLDLVDPEKIAELKLELQNAIPKIDAVIEAPVEESKPDSKDERKKQAEKMVEEIKNNLKELHHLPVVEKEVLQAFKQIVTEFSGVLEELKQ